MRTPGNATYDVLLVTCRAMPAGEDRDGPARLVDALAARGLRSRWVAWDDPEVDWSTPLVAVRAAWDYHERREEFLAWAGRVPRLLNGADTFAWNTDKAYLLDLEAAGVPVVPTASVHRRPQLGSAIAAHGSAVVKPRVGAGGQGVVVTRSADEVAGRGPWMVQPVVESVRTEGEVSVFVLGGETVTQARKRPAAGEIRVHEEYGGRTEPEPVTAEAAAIAHQAVVAAEQALERRLDYARADLMRLSDGRLAVGELELVEPGLYLDVLPENAAHFAATVAGVLA